MTGLIKGESWECVTKNSREKQGEQDLLFVWQQSIRSAQSYVRGVSHFLKWNKVIQAQFGTMVRFVMCIQRMDIMCCVAHRRGLKLYHQVMVPC